MIREDICRAGTGGEAMRLPRMTTRRLMVAVAVASLAIWFVTDALVRSPERRHVRRMIAHHEMRAGAWEFAGGSWADGERPGLTKECQRLARWHRRRIRELGGGLPKDERWWDEGDRTTKYEERFFGQIGASGMPSINYRAIGDRYPFALPE
jgi:hypothetical protein